MAGLAMSAVAGSAFATSGPRTPSQETRPDPKSLTGEVPWPPVAFTVHRPAASAYAFAQTPDRYLWVGTSWGLLRFDGRRWVRFEGGRDGLPAAPVRALLARDDGDLWVGTGGGGLVRMVRGGPATRFESTAGLPSGTVTALSDAGARGIWIGTSVGPARMISDGTVVVFAEGWPGGPVLAMFVDRAGAFWFESATAWLRFDEGTRRLVSGPRIDDEGTDETAARARLGLSLALRYDGDDPPLSAPVFRGLHDGHRRGAIATRAGGHLVASATGLVAIDGWRRRVFRQEHGLATDDVTGLFEDHEGNVWVGSAASGATMMKRPRVFALSRWLGSPGETANAVATGPDAVVWMTFARRLVRFSRGKYQQWPAETLPDPGALQAIAVASDGSAFVGRDRNAILHVKGETLSALRVPGVDDGRAPAVLHADADGRLWVGFPDGAVGLLDRLGVTLARLPGAGCAGATPRAPCGDGVTSIARRRAGGVLVGTHRAGVWALDGQRASVFVSGQDLGHLRALAVLEDREGVVWIGTPAGLFRVAATPERQRHQDVQGTAPVRLGPAHGLPGARVDTILEDGTGALWIGSDRGAYAASKRALAVAGGAVVAPVVRFGVDDGFISERVNAAFGAGGARDSEGRLWFATVDGGVVALDPPEERPEGPAARAILEEASVPGGERASGRSDASFRFTAAAFAEPHRVRLRHRLSGVDDVFVETGTDGLARYASLPAGRHSFEMAAVRDDELAGPGASAPLRFAFEVPRRLHETLGFRLAAFGALAAMLVLWDGLRRRETRALVRAAREDGSGRVLALAKETDEALLRAVADVDKVSAVLTAGPSGVRGRLLRLRMLAGWVRLAARHARATRPLDNVGSLVIWVQEVAWAMPGVEIDVTLQPPLSASMPIEPALAEELCRRARGLAARAVVDRGARCVHVDLGLDRRSGHLRVKVRHDGAGPVGGDAQDREAGFD